MSTQSEIKKTSSLKLAKTEIIADYKLAVASREASLIGRKEVFMGKAKFGIFGDGKELAQIAMSKVFRKGDFRSGYYRDQTFMLAIGELTIQQYFAQLYAHTDLEADPSSAGRLMNGHFATRMLDDDGDWRELSQLKNSASDISPTAGQMPRLLGLAWASKLFRENPDLQAFTQFSDRGNEIAFGTIGNASTSEGMFLETINAGGVLQVPLLISVWDDEYGISVPNEYHTTKSSISKALAGFQRTNEEAGYEILTVKGWNYEELITTYRKAETLARKSHIPVLIHVIEMTQPQGHSTSGSHERYKTKERLEWEIAHDCIKKFREWILENNLADADELNTIEKEAKQFAKDSKMKAWKAFMADIQEEQEEALELLEAAANESANNNDILELREDLEKSINPVRLDTMRTVRKALRYLRNNQGASRKKLIDWVRKVEQKNRDRFSSHLYSESDRAVTNIPVVKATYSEKSPLVDGRQVLQACFDAALKRDPRILAFGEDVGKIGDVNQAFQGLQEKYGELRVMDTGIRELTIVGQGIGAALRGLRPIAEIQYLDYLVYALATLTDDLACLQYRTKGGQKAPVIIRTRGHRLEGVWHAGSPMSMMLGSLRGIHLLVPRDMTQAAGMYNTLFQSDEPAIMVESLNGYRLKERVPDNVAEFTTPLGIPEVIRSGSDITVVTYGSMVRIVAEAAKQLEKIGISVEIIDVQTLLPFDIHHAIVESVKKTNRVLFTDEDVPGGATAYMMQKVLEEQDAYFYLDSQPATLPATEHRPAYGSDGDYFSKPNVESVFDKVYQIMHEADPRKYPAIYS